MYRTSYRTSTMDGLSSLQTSAGSQQPKGRLAGSHPGSHNMCSSRSTGSTIPPLNKGRFSTIGASSFLEWSDSLVSPVAQARLWPFSKFRVAIEDSRGWLWHFYLLDTLDIYPHTVENSLLFRGRRQAALHGMVTMMPCLARLLRLGCLIRQKQGTEYGDPPYMGEVLSCHHRVYGVPLDALNDTLRRRLDIYHGSQALISFSLVSFSLWT
jgi:hypothetical protein